MASDSIGVDRRHIKIRGSNIYLNDQLHGKIIESELSLVSNPVESPIEVSPPVTVTLAPSPSNATPVPSPATCPSPNPK